MLRKYFLTVAAGSLFVGGLAATHLAFAQPGPEGGPRGRGGVMAMADANKDGKISKAELTSALDSRFVKMDVDRDGQFTQKDRDQLRQQRQEARFAAMDANKDGQISKTEFASALQARADKRAEMRGPEGEGRKWRGGRRGGGGFGPMAAARQDGVVTKAEFMAGPLAMFDRADANKDGSVTAEEMKAARGAMRGQWRARQAPQG